MYESRCRSSPTLERNPCQRKRGKRFHSREGRPARRRLDRNPISDTVRKRSGQFSCPAASRLALSPHAAWSHNWDRRRSAFSGHNIWSHIPCRCASTHGLMRSYLRFPQVINATRLLGANVWRRTNRASAAHPCTKRRSVCSVRISARRTIRFGMWFRTSDTGESWGHPRARGRLAQSLAGKWS